MGLVLTPLHSSLVGVKERGQPSTVVHHEGTALGSLCGDAAVLQVQGDLWAGRSRSPGCSAEPFHYSHSLPALALHQPLSYLTPVSSAQHLKPDGSHCEGINHLSPGLICGERRWHHTQLTPFLGNITPSAQAGIPTPGARELWWKLGTTTLPQPWPPTAGAALCQCPV